MGIDPNHFGPYFWTTIHFICLGASDNLTSEQKHGFIQFFNNLHYVIPCSSCGQHLRENIEKIKPIEDVLNSSHELFKWSVDLHNIVNDMLSKPRMSYEDAYKFWRSLPYADFTNKTNNSNNEKNEIIKIIYKENHQQSINYILLFIIGLLIGILIYYLFTFF